MSSPAASPSLPPVGLGGLQHVTLCIPHVEEARAFYTGVLGLRLAPRPDFPTEGLWLEAGHALIHLIVPFDATELPRPRSLARTPVAPHLAFTVPALEPAMSALRARGVEVIVSDLAEGQAFFTDPFGNLLELNAPVEDPA